MARTRSQKTVQNNKITDYLRKDEVIPKVPKVSIKLKNLTKQDIEEIQKKLTNVKRSKSKRKLTPEEDDDIEAKRRKVSPVEYVRMTRSKARALGVTNEVFNDSQIVSKTTNNSRHKINAKRTLNKISSDNKPVNNMSTGEQNTFSTKSKSHSQVMERQNQTKAINSKSLIASCSNATKIPPDSFSADKPVIDMHMHTGERHTLSTNAVKSKLQSPVMGRQNQSPAINSISQIASCSNATEISRPNDKRSSSGVSRDIFIDNEPVIDIHTGDRYASQAHSTSQIMGESNQTVAMEYKSQSTSCTVGTKTSRPKPYDKRNAKKNLTDNESVIDLYIDDQKSTQASNNVVKPDYEPQILKCSNDTIARIDYTIGQIVWAKIKGSPAWPAKIKAFSSGKRSMVLVVWFNDYRTTKVYQTQIFKFLQHFDEFAVNFDESIGLRTAAQEALMVYGQRFAMLQ